MIRVKFCFLILLCFSLSAKAQRVDTLTRENKFRVAPFIIPAVFVGYGLMGSGNNFINDIDRNTRERLVERHALFSLKADDYLRYVPAAAVYGLHLSGVTGKNSVVDATGNYVVSMAISMSVVSFTKKISHRLRPDGTTYDAFPSGHTSTSFASAEFLNQEYKDISPFIGYAGYAVALTTGVFRLYNNRHWVTDVVAGAGVGIASTKLGYLLYPHLKRALFGKNETNFSLVPLYQEGKAGLSFAGRF